MEENMTVITDPKTFILILIGLKNVDQNLKHEIGFIIKSSESLANKKTRNETEQLLSKYKNENNTHEHRKQQNK